MLVSIVVPTYNSCSTVKRAIKSIPFLKDIEVIVVDDGSTDNTLKTLDFLKKKYPLSIIKTLHRGAAGARNEGIKCAHGKYILFLDSDDTFKLTLIKSNILEILKGYDYDVININSRIKKDTAASDGEKGKLLLDNLGLSKKEDIIWLSGPISKFYRREFLLDNKIFFDEHVLVGEDMVFNQISINKAKKIYLQKGDIYQVIVNPNSITHTVLKKDFFQDNINLIEAIHNCGTESRLLNSFIVKRYFMLYVQFVKSNYNYYTIYKQLKQFVELYYCQVKNYDRKLLINTIGNGHYFVLWFLLRFPILSILFTPLLRKIITNER